MALKMQAVALQTTLFLINQFVLMFLYYMLEMVILALRPSTAVLHLHFLLCLVWVSLCLYDAYVSFIDKFVFQWGDWFYALLY